jgi:hypothetical protein
MLRAPTRLEPANRMGCPAAASLGRSLLFALVFVLLESGLSEKRLAAQSDPLQRWELRYPARSSLAKVVCGNGVFAAIAESPSGALSVSKDGKSWTETPLAFGGEAAALSDIAFGNGAFVGVTDTGEVLSSSDGTEWRSLSVSPVANAAASTLLRIAAGNALIVILSEDGWVSVSPDGLNWSEPERLEGRAVDLLFGSGMFLALTSDGATAGSTVLASADGITWTSQAEQIGGPVADVSFSDEMFVALASNFDLVISRDGVNWFHLASVPMANDSRPVRFLFGNSRFAGVVVLPSGDAQVLISLNGVDWIAPLTGPVPNGILFGNGIFLLYGATTYTSTTGLSWEIAETGVLGALPTSVAFGNDRFVAVGGNSLLLSFDGKSWAPVETSGTPRLPTGIYFANGTFLGPSWPEYSPHTHLPVEGYLLSSTDGVSWTEHSGPPVLSSFRSIVHGNGTYVAIGQGSQIYASGDGIQWSKRADTEALTQILFGNGVFLASAYRPGANSAAPFRTFIYRSADGLTWTKLPFVFDGGLALRAFANGVFVAQAVASFQRFVMTSRDGDQWTRQFTGSNIGFVSTAYGGFGAGHFVMLSPAAVLSSVDTLAWGERGVNAPMTVAEEALHPALAYGKQTFVTVVRGRIQQSAPVPPPYAVRIVADISEASDWGPQPGRLAFTRSDTSPLGIDLPVRFQLNGTAQDGEDYLCPATTVVIPAGTASASLEITPIARPLERTTKTVIATLVPDDQYTIQEPASATITISFVGLHPRFAPDGISLASDGSIHLVIESAPGVEFELQTSLDLNTWSGLTNIVSPTGLLLFIDPPTTEQQRFYRAVPRNAPAVSATAPGETAERRDPRLQ